MHMVCGLRLMRPACQCCIVPECLGYNLSYSIMLTPLTLLQSTFNAFLSTCYSPVRKVLIGLGWESAWLPHLLTPLTASFQYWSNVHFKTTLLPCQPYRQLFWYFWPMKEISLGNWAIKLLVLPGTHFTFSHAALTA